MVAPGSCFLEGRATPRARLVLPGLSLRQSCPLPIPTLAQGTCPNDLPSPVKTFRGSHRPKKPCSSALYRSPSSRPPAPPLPPHPCRHPPRPTRPPAGLDKAKLPLGISPLQDTLLYTHTRTHAHTHAYTCPHIFLQMHTYAPAPPTPPRHTHTYTRMHSIHTRAPTHGRTAPSTRTKTPTRHTYTCASTHTYPHISHAHSSRAR